MGFLKKNTILVPALLALGVLTFGAGAAQAATAPETLTYRVYGGGINVVNASLRIAPLPQGRYRIALAAATRGFLKIFAPWSGEFSTIGWDGKGGADKPEIYRSSSTWRGETESKEYSYDKASHFLGLKVTDKKGNVQKKPVDKALSDDTTDVLTATLEVMKHVGKGGECAGSSDIFDGDRRFTMIFRDKGAETLKANQYNAYQGVARRCEVEIVPKGGLWHKKPRGWLSIQEQGRQNGMLPTVWLARMEEGMPAVPVKIMVKSDYGALLMNLADYRHGAKTMAAAEK